MDTPSTKELLPLKIHYFLFASGISPIIPFMPVIVKQYGFSSTVVGTIYTILQFSSLLTKPILGTIVDRFQQQKSILFVFQLLTIVSTFLVMVVPKGSTPLLLNFVSDNETLGIHKCPDFGASPFDGCKIHSFEQDKSNESMICKLNCEIEPWLMESICASWNSTLYCQTNGTENLKLVTYSLLHTASIVDRCISFTIENQIFPYESALPLLWPTGNKTLNFHALCRADCDNRAVTEIMAPIDINNSEVTHLFLFWILLFLLAVSWISIRAVTIISDSICFEVLGQHYHLFGNQRLWGALGLGLFAFLSGFLIDKVSVGYNEKDYTALFFLMVVLLICDMIVSTQIKYTKPMISENIVKDVQYILKSKTVIMFLIWCIALGIGTSLIWSFLFWHLEALATAQKGCNHMDAIKTLEGLVILIQSFGGDLPFFFISGWIFKKIGYINTMNLVLLCFCVRFLFYSLLVNPWWVLPIEFLNGITSGVAFAVMKSYAKLIAPMGTETTLQGLVGAVFEGVGVSSGTLIGGILFDRIGGSLTFCLYGISALICLILLVIAQKFIKNNNDTTEKEYLSDELIFNEKQYLLRQNYNSLQ